MTAPRLLTFAPMIDSETTRLLCRWYGIAYEEEDHLFGWVSLLTLAHGGYGRVPLLYGRGMRLSGPRALVDHFDSSVPIDRRLLPIGSGAATVEADWDSYNGDVALDVAVFSYFHLLADRALMAPIFASPVPAAEARLVPRVYPAMASLLAILLRLSPERAAASSKRIRAQFAALDRRIADGRRFLRGERLALGDIAIAAAAAPLLQPAGYGALMPPVAAMPAAIQDLVGALRLHPAAAYVERVYAAATGNLT